MGKGNKKSIFIWNTIGSTLNAFSSLIFLIIVTRFNSLSDAGVFSFSFATACLFYILAVYSGRVYQVSDLDESHDDSNYIYNRLITSIITIIIVALFCVTKKYDSAKFIIMLLLMVFKVLEAISECFYAIIQKEGSLDKVGFSMTLKAIVDYIIFFIVDYFTKSIIISIISIIAVNILIMILYDYRNVKKTGYERKIFNLKINKDLFKSGFFVCLYTFFLCYIFNSSRYAIDNLLSDDLQSIFGIIIMPAQVMSLLSQFIIHPFLNDLNGFIKNEDYEAYHKMVRKMIFLIIILGIVIILLGYVLGIPILQILYGVSLKKYRLSFLIIMFGALFYGIIVLISYILISLDILKQQSIILGLVSAICVFLSNALVSKLEIFGASINYLFAMILAMILYLICFEVNIRKRKSRSKS